MFIAHSYRGHQRERHGSQPDLYQQPRLCCAWAYNLGLSQHRQHQVVPSVLAHEIVIGLHSYRVHSIKYRCLHELVKTSKAPIASMLRNKGNVNIKEYLHLPNSFPIVSIGTQMHFIRP